VRAKAIGTVLMLASMSGLASTQVLTPQGAFRMYDSEWYLVDNPLSKVRARQRYLETVRALPDCATLKPPYGRDQRCQAPSRCEIPGTGVSIGCLRLYKPRVALFGLVSHFIEEIAILPLLNFEWVFCGADRVKGGPRGMRPGAAHP
jgi:hypothetical protein